MGATPRATVAVYWSLDMIENRFLKKRNISKDDRAHVIETIKDFLSGKTNMVFAYVHGSFAEGGSFRDIDIAVYAQEPYHEMEIESDFSYELSEKTTHPVEVMVINKSPVAFQMAVLRKGLVLFSRSEDVRTDFIEDVSKRYREYAHFRNICLNA